MVSKPTYLSIDSPESTGTAESMGFWSDCWKVVVAILTPLASLKVTVVLFLMSIFIVFAGTLAQTERDIWQVVHDYFRMDLTSLAAAGRTAFAWIDFRIFFPRPFFPQMKPLAWGFGFYFPNGWLIGIGLFVNLTAAHVIRFRIQSRGPRLLAGLLTLLLGGLLTAVVIAAGSFQTADLPQVFTAWPSLRILWLLVQCAAASLVLLVGCRLVFRKRAGIVLLHAGIGLLMIGELIVGVAAIESQMQIIEGQTINYVMDTRELELAVIDNSGKTEDEVFAIPQSRLQVDTRVHEADLPVDVELVRFMANSRLRAGTAGEKNLATAGQGRSQIAEEIAPISGTDNSGRMNQPTAYVRFFDKPTGQSLGVYRLGLFDWMAGRVETLQAGDRSYSVALRYKHHYQPFSMHLIDVERQDYMGTQTARSYASSLRLVDPDRNVDRRVRIWMNNPLRYAGATFYQSSYGTDPATGKEYTGLQVVTNTGWRIPYVACVMVVFGMLAQFWVTLQRYLARKAEGRLATGDREPSGPDKPAAADVGKRGARHQVSGSTGGARHLGWIVPLAVVLCSAVWLVSKLHVPDRPSSHPDFSGFGRLPVVHEGRIKPFDTLARASLRKVSDRSYWVDEQGRRQPAVRWLLDVITDADAARDHKVFRIHNLDVLETLGLERRSGFRYAINEFAGNIGAFEQQVARARSLETSQLDLYARKILDLDQRLNQFLLLQEAFRLPHLRSDHFSEDWQRETNRLERAESMPMPLAVPPSPGKTAWQSYTKALFDAVVQRMASSQGLESGELNPATVAMLGILSAYSDEGKNATAFNQKVEEYQSLLARTEPPRWNVDRLSFEARFNHAAPLYHAMILYALAALLGVLSWMGATRLLHRTAVWLCLFTLVAHTLALAGRIYISGRPPVTTLYTSTLFVGWACVLIGLLMEWYSKRGVAVVVAATTGFLALLVGYALTTKVDSFKGDSFTVLVAVLDTNFWLATHVVCVAAGYSATFFAGFLGMVYVLRGLVTPSLTPRLAKDVARMIYGTVCFAIFFSFFGTVLGGLWADDSWGRFWGWDPKENGALIIVLWNAVVLHALWGRMVSDRGLAVLVILGNVVTAWSWFGVNELQVGLHSYGFTEGVLKILAAWVGLNLFLAACGLIPQKLWRSWRAKGQLPPSAEPIR